jgi:hypothetical protein
MQGTAHDSGRANPGGFGSAPGEATPALPSCPVNSTFMRRRVGPISSKKVASRQPQWSSLGFEGHTQIFTNVVPAGPPALITK